MFGAADYRKIHSVCIGDDNQSPAFFNFSMRCRSHSAARSFGGLNFLRTNSLMEPYRSDFSRRRRAICGGIRIVTRSMGPQSRQTERLGRFLWPEPASDTEYLVR